MIVKGSEGIAHVAKHIREYLLPKTTDAYVSRDIDLTAMLLDMISEDYDRAVDVLLADREEICAIFRQALPVVDDQLRERIEQSLSTEVCNMRVRLLTERADTDMKVLIALHEVVDDAEEKEEAWITTINLDIWQFIENYASRRAYLSPI
jgi:hypothetical protein